jgi:hypothetical protein
VVVNLFSLLINGYLCLEMNLSAIRKNLKLFFSVFTLLFAVAYFSSFFNYYTPRYAKTSHTSIEEFVTQAGTSVVSVSQHLYKITGLDHFVFDITLSSSSIEIASSKAFFVSLFERNVFYVLTTINAP